MFFADLLKFQSVGGYSDDPDENTNHEIRTGILALDLVNCLFSFCFGLKN